MAQVKEIVSTTEIAPLGAETIVIETTEARTEVASQWQLIWWKFRKHRLAMVSLVLVLALYFIAIFAGFFAPQQTDLANRNYTEAPPQPIYWFDNGAFSPHVYAYKKVTDPKTLRRLFTVDETTKIPLGFFVKGNTYKIGLHSLPIAAIQNLAVSSDIHFFGPVNPGDPFYPLGADYNGRDVLSRLIYSSQVSLSLGLVGVFISLVLGILLGGLSGLIGGLLDTIIQRSIEILTSIPGIPIMMALATAVPQGTPPTHVYFIITLILSLQGWTGLGRVVRGKFLALREEDFITAARLDGVPRMRIILKHMIPSFLSHIIATVTLTIPAMILTETALSFIGVGLREPVVSWGVMLQDAMKISNIAKMPWLMVPGIAVMITVLALNFLGDGLRDAADPYH